MEISLSDPTYSLTRAPSTAERIAERFIMDRRDLPFLKLMALLSVTVVPTGVALFVPGAFSWWLAGLHLGLVFWFMGPYILMLHNTSHRPLFKRPYRFLRHYIPTFLGPFFGESPETYFAHHLGMHHPENNLADDLSSTMSYRRDSFLGWLRYFLRFFFAGIFELTRYFYKKNRRSLLIHCAAGELSWIAGVTLLVVFCGWRAPFVVFVLPLIVARFAMMAGNWGQHAFIDQADPANCYTNSITCINATYNERCFNDGYHIGHHVKQNRHWTEMPEDFQRNVGKYAAEKSIVFQKIDFFVVWLLLMLKKYDTLAGLMVNLGETEMTTEEKVAFMKSRTQWTAAA